MDKEFLEQYDGQSAEELVALRNMFRIDSLVLAFEKAVSKKLDPDLSEPERVILVVEAMEREVNNGGYDQFLLNSSREHALFLVRALTLIGCPDVAALSAKALEVAGVRDDLEISVLEEVVANMSDAQRDRLDECDRLYYQNTEPIADRLFSYIEQHLHEIRIP
jgi:hypothetical protein